MKVAISSVGKDPESNVSEVSGRAKYYLVFENKKLVKTMKNPFAIGGGGAGYGVAKMLEREDVDLVVSGRIGDNMKNSLKSAGIRFKEVNIKKVKEALEEV